MSDWDTIPQALLVDCAQLVKVYLSFLASAVYSTQLTITVNRQTQLKVNGEHSRKRDGLFIEGVC